MPLISLPLSKVRKLKTGLLSLCGQGQDFLPCDFDLFENLFDIVIMTELMEEYF